MTTRIWAGGSGLWTDPTAWDSGAAPQLGDTAMVSAGTVDFVPGETVDAATILLGSAAPGAPATLVLQNALFGFSTTIDSTAPGAQALLEAIGQSGLNGAINATASGGTFTIETSASGATPGSLTLLEGASVTVSGGEAMVLDGVLDNHGTVDVGSGGDFVNNGTIAQSAAVFEVESGGTLGGTGLFEIGLYNSLYFDSGAAASSEDVRFTDVGGRLLLADPADFTGIIANFETGDLIDLTSTVADGASYDAATNLLTVTDGATVVATLTLDTPAGDMFLTATDGGTGTLVELQDTQTRLNYTIDAADRAIGGDTVRATMTTHDGTPITGAGVRVGIISDSFNVPLAGGTVDPADTAAADGYLPETPGGTSAVQVLIEGEPGDGDEGLALAELVHQEAPGANLDFASADGGLGGFASAVTALQQAGCNVIIDDVTYDTEPFFQDAGSLDTVIDDATASGVTYISAAGNYGADAYQSSFTGTTETLFNGKTAPAQVFGNGTPYQDVTLDGGITASFDLQWATPYATTPGPTTLQLALFNASDQPVATSTPYADLDDGGTDAGAELTYTPGTTAQYQLAIYGTLPAGTTFKYILLGGGSGGTTVPGTIDDPAATAGTIFGHAMLPDVISVGAVDFPDTPAFGSASGYIDYYSGTGPSDFRFDANGDPIAQQVVAGPDVVAPVDAGTTVFAPFAGTSAAAASAAGIAALMLQADPALTPAQVQSMMEQSASDLGQPAELQGTGLIDAPAAVQLALAAAPCFAAGTRIATANGLVAVERLRPGDLALTLSGAFQPVVWLGHRRVDCRRHPRPADMWPVRVNAGAFGNGMPGREVSLSPDHSVFIDGDGTAPGVLIPVRYLINGATISQQHVESITYWHVELARHDVLLAEGLPCESYLDTGNRAAFDNGIRRVPARAQTGFSKRRTDAGRP